MNLGAQQPLTGIVKYYNRLEGNDELLPVDFGFRIYCSYRRAICSRCNLVRPQNHLVRWSSWALSLRDRWTTYGQRSAGIRLDKCLIEHEPAPPSLCIRLLRMMWHERKTSAFVWIPGRPRDVFIHRRSRSATVWRMLKCLRYGRDVQPNFFGSRRNGISRSDWKEQTTFRSASYFYWLRFVTFVTFDSFDVIRVSLRRTWLWDEHVTSICLRQQNVVP